MRRVSASESPPVSRHPLAEADEEDRRSVRAILDAVSERGWEAVRSYSREFDGMPPAQEAVPPAELDAAFGELPPDQQDALECARTRIERYQRAFLPRSGTLSDGAGGRLGRIVRPMDTVGCYVPGGRVPLPSTVLMTALVARVAGVEEVVLCSPPVEGEGGQPHPVIRAAASRVEDVGVFGVGGVQAIGAMAFGAGPVPAVDMIAGPGNLYVTLAKREVFGTVQVDMLAGPSEIAILAEPGVSEPDYMAADLLGQAEHDPASRVYLLSPDPDLLEAVAGRLDAMLEGHPRREAVEASLEHSALVDLEDLEEGVRWINDLAPEHLELHLENPERWSRSCRHAGAIFCGPYSPEAVGDYLAGPSHTLPTGGSARFFSPLSAASFCRTQSLIGFDRAAFQAVREDARTLAEMESLDAHAQSLDVRS